MRWLVMWLVVTELVGEVAGKKECYSDKRRVF
jgi:hypothetical protein